MTTDVSKTAKANAAIDRFYGEVGDGVVKGAVKAGKYAAVAGKYVKGNTYDKLDAVLKRLGEDGELVKLSDPLSHEKLVGPLDETSSRLAKFDQKVSQIGDEVSKKVGRAGYTVIKTGLSLFGLGHFRLGRVIREALGTAVGVLLRLAIKVAEYALRILPWIASAIVYSLPGVGLFLAMKIKKLENELAANRSAVPAPSTPPTYADSTAGRTPPTYADSTAGRTPPTYADSTAGRTPPTYADSTQVASRMPSKRTIGLTAAGIAGIAAYAINPIIALAIPVILETVL